MSASKLDLVPVVHPLTGETYHMHPYIAAQPIRWIDPDPRVPTPPESLPLFDLDALGKVLVTLFHSCTARAAAEHEQLESDHV